MPDISATRQVMEDYIPTAKMASLRQKPLKKANGSTISLTRVAGQSREQLIDDIYRQSASKSLTVNLASLEIYRNDITKKVKLLDVKLSFSYQEKFTTQTVRLEKQLVRHGKKWTWVGDDGSRNVITFPYCPGDRVNLNIGIIVHKTKKHGLFGKETVTTQAGTTTECIVLAKNNGVGMGLPLNASISNNLRLNFNLNGHGKYLTVKLRMELKHETKGPPIIWLRPMSSDKKFRSYKSALELIQEQLPPKEKDEDARVKMFVYNQQKLVNYHRTAVLECRSIRPADIESEIPTGIELRQSIGSRILSYLFPVVKIIDSQKMRYRLAILVVTEDGPYCLCSAKWKSADKFDYKIYMYKTGETFGQRIKWASKDSLDIKYTVLNSTGHQFTLRQDSQTCIEDICIGVCLKFLVRWCNETLPWKNPGNSQMFDAQKYLRSTYRGSPSGEQGDIQGYVESLPAFLESNDLLLFTDVEEFIRDVSMEEVKTPLTRTGSSSSYGECAIKRGEINIEQDPDDDDIDEVDNTTVGSKPKFEIEWDDLTTSGFVDSELTGACSWIDSVL